MGFSVSLGVALAIAAITALALSSVLTGNEHVSEEGIRHRLAVEQLRRVFSDKLASQHAHELTGGPSHLEDARQARLQFQALLLLLRTHEDGQKERGLLDGLEQAERGHEDATQELWVARSQGLSPEGLEGLRGGQEEARYQTYEALDWLAWYTEDTFTQRVLRADQAERRAFWLIILVATLGLLVAMGLAWVLTRALWPLHHEARASEARFRLLVEGVKDYALYMLDPEGRVVSWNPGAERIQGWRAEEIIGRTGEVFYAPEARAAGQPRGDLERAAREGRLEWEGPGVRKDGSRFWAESLVTALRGADGRLEGFAVLTRDSSERKRLERAQHLFVEAERLFLTEKEPDEAVEELTRLLVPELADGCLLFLLTPAGELVPRAITHVSPEKERLMWELVQGGGGPRPDRRHGAWQALRTGRTERITEVSPESMAEAASDAEELERMRELEPVSYLSVPLRAAGHAVGVLMLVSQRPERRFTETDQVFVEELAGRAALSLENARLLREAQAALDLIGVAAHDLGNPLQALQLMLGKLRRLPPSEPEKLREVLTAAVRHTQRLGRLLHNLLDLSRLSSGKMELEVGEVDLAELAHEAVERHAEQAAEVGSQVVLEVEPGVVGRWDRLRLERVLTNLLSNAFKYGKGHPIELRVERTDGHGRLSVRDHGPGIPEELQRTIFERFKKAPAKGEKKEGFGLGLYIVQQLVEAHGGCVRVESREGEGATFTVELPLAAASREVDDSTQPPGMVH
ncbi:PAS domain S-box-containing protein [Archangium gephyra]|uniref:histidine kinase n=1 Tax=Archangium gephyra TaxID=48 RepID=A0AAC8TAL4_9BACT|nr:Sensory box histidine kinase/response regulator [Archangium gephyra]REG30875.1 PAS domain S-box-containing protein [Archangium gephyra]